jgi:hypothetical protein
MNSDEVRALVQAMRERDAPIPKMLPGVVKALSPGVAEVVLDSDPDGVVLSAALLISDVAVGDRVMVMFEPPRGVYVTDVINQVRAAGTSMFFSTTDQNVTDLINSAYSDPYELLGSLGDPFDEQVLYVLALEYVTLEARRIYRVDLNLGSPDFQPITTCGGCSQTASVRILSSSSGEFQGEWMPTIPSSPPEDGRGRYLPTYTGSPPSVQYVNRAVLPGLLIVGTTGDSQMFSLGVYVTSEETYPSAAAVNIGTLWEEVFGGPLDPLPDVGGRQAPSASAIGMFYSTSKQDVLVQHLLEVRGQHILMSQASITDAGPLPPTFVEP